MFHFNLSFSPSCSSSPLLSFGLLSSCYKIYTDADLVSQSLRVLISDFPPNILKLLSRNCSPCLLYITYYSILRPFLEFVSANAFRIEITFPSDPAVKRFEKKKIRLRYGLLCTLEENIISTSIYYTSKYFNLALSSYRSISLKIYRNEIFEMVNVT